MAWVLPPGVEVRTELSCIVGHPAGIGELAAAGVGTHHIVSEEEPHTCSTSWW